MDIVISPGIGTRRRRGRGDLSGIPYDEAASPHTVSYPRTLLPAVYRRLLWPGLLGQSLFYYSLNSKATSSTDKSQSTEKDTRTLLATESSSELKSTMTTVKPLILLLGALLLLGKGKGVVALDQAVHGDEELLSGGLEGFKGFEGRQFSSLVGTAPWLQGAGHLLRLFGEGRFDNQPVWPLSL